MTCSAVREHQAAARIVTMAARRKKIAFHRLILLQ